MMNLKMPALVVACTLVLTACGGNNNQSGNAPAASA